MKKNDPYYYSLSFSSQMTFCYVHFLPSSAILHKPYVVLMFWFWLEDLSISKMFVHKILLSFNLPAVPCRWLMNLAQYTHATYINCFSCRWLEGSFLCLSGWLPVPVRGGPQSFATLVYATLRRYIRNVHLFHCAHTHTRARLLMMWP